MLALKLDVPWETYLHIAGVSRTLNISVSQAYHPQWEDPTSSLPSLKSCGSTRQPFSGKSMLLVISTPNVSLPFFMLSSRVSFDFQDRGNQELHRKLACAAGAESTHLVTILDDSPHPLNYYDYVLIEPSSEPIAQRAHSKGARFIVGIPWFRESIIMGSIPHSGLPAETDIED